jgi:hypothetical protein
MAKMGAGVAIGLLVAAISFFEPSAALALRLGPFRLGLPFFGHSFTHPHRARPHSDDQTGVAYNATENAEAAGKEPSQAAAGPASALLNPSLALPTIYDDVFWPASSWPVGYDEVLQAAFARAAGDRDRRLCQADRGSTVVKHIAGVIRPDETQRPLLQKLGGALAVASGFLGRFCANEIPPQPVARLRLVETQLEALIAALDIPRRPLQDLEQSLDRHQRARLAAALAAPSAGSRDAAASTAPVCDVMPTTVERMIDVLNRSVQPENDTQRAAMVAAKQAFNTAAYDLDAQCPMSLPVIPSERLKATQARLDAVWRAVLTIRVALENLEKGLNDKQRVRLNALEFASGREGKVIGRN